MFSFHYCNLICEEKLKPRWEEFSLNRDQKLEKEQRTQRTCALITKVTAVFFHNGHWKKY